MSKGYSLIEAQQLSYKATEGMVIKQTYLLTYIDGFWFIGIFFLLCIPLLYLQKFNRKAKIGGGGH